MPKLIKAKDLIGLDAASVTILDVRTTEEYNLGTVPGSINANFDYENEEFDEEALAVVSKLPKDLSTYVFCRTGPRSELAAAALEAMGFAEVYDVEGGYRAYQRALILHEMERE